MGMYDQYQDWRLDVDNMTYEVPTRDIHRVKQKELLDLEDRMGYVSTGLSEDEIIRSLRMVKFTAFNTKHFSTEMDRRCSICQYSLLVSSLWYLRLSYPFHSMFQEEFEVNEEIGKLSCGHNYHVHCIKQWLSRKNSCPVCKTTISKT
ncbi:hypothetical protein EJB05_58035, partial [Eragrostis curvula]